MLTALLLPLLVAGAPGGSGARAASDDPAIQVWISSDRKFLPGEHAKVQVRTLEDGYLIVLHVDPDGHLRVLFPIDPKDDNFVRGGRKYEIRGRGGRESFTADDRTGRGTVYAAVSRGATASPRGPAPPCAWTRSRSSTISSAGWSTAVSTMTP